MEILTRSVKSPLPLFAKEGVIPPFGKGRSEGIFVERLDNHETIDNPQAQGSADGHGRSCADSPSA
jgi:hypothetical protein